MSIEETDVIDFIGVNEKENEVVLTISDHLGWGSDASSHLLLLQEKINTYSSFIGSGELLDSYPDANGRKVVISIVAQHSLNEEAQNFIVKVKHILSDAGMSLRFEEFSDA